MKDVTVREIVDYLESITTHVSQTWKFVLRRNCCGEIDSGGGVTDLTFSSLSELKSRIRESRRQSAEKRVIEAAKAITKASHRCCCCDDFKEICSAVDALPTVPHD